MPDTSGRFKLVDHITNSRILDSDKPDNLSALLDRRHFIGLTAAAVVTALTSVGALNILSPSFAFATPTAAEKQAEADEVRRKLDDWGEQLNKASDDYYNALDAHDLAVQEMGKAQTKIDDATAREVTLQVQLGDRATSMYKNGPLNFLDVVLGAKSFSEFTNSWDMIDSLNNRDSELITEAQTARTEAETARADFQSQEQIAQQKMNEASDIKAEAERIISAYQTELDQLDAEIADLIEQERIAEEQRLAAANYAATGGSPSANYVNAFYDGTKAGTIIGTAYSKLGCPYVWGATGPSTFDCSGLTFWCYRAAGTILPRGGNAQYWSAPVRLPVSAAQPGDLLWKYNHIGIYIGGGQFIHAPNPSTVVKITNLAGYGWAGAARW